MIMYTMLIPVSKLKALCNIVYQTLKTSGVLVLDNRSSPAFSCGSQVLKCGQCINFPEKQNLCQVILLLFPTWVPLSRAPSPCRRRTQCQTPEGVVYDSVYAFIEGGSADGKMPIDRRWIGCILGNPIFHLYWDFFEVFANWGKCHLMCQPPERLQWREAPQQVCPSSRWGRRRPGSVGTCGASSPSAGSTPAHLDDHIVGLKWVMVTCDDSDHGVHL